MEISNEQRAATANRIIAIHAELRCLDERPWSDGKRGQQLEGELKQLGRIRWLNHATT